MREFFRRIGLLLRPNLTHATATGAGALTVAGTNTAQPPLSNLCLFSPLFTESGWRHA